jgi:hypothetical protein
MIHIINTTYSLLGDYTLTQTLSKKYMLKTLNLFRKKFESSSGL